MIKSLSDSHYKVIIARLVAEREGKSVSQIDLAIRLGITQSAISKIERCERRLDISEFIKLCNALGISASELVKDFETPDYQGNK